jgi:hypothetical protein
MPISVVVRTNYSNQDLGRWVGGESVNRICDIGRSDRSRFPLLYGVDPYGNTWFNCLQMEQMIDELNAVREVSDDSEVAEAITELLLLAEIVCEKPHRSMRFLGD